ncbi:MAG: hypothetical protein GY710_05435 [Desulfobacteraceae bacterium]|nr:hypothetical protein [Desulfobacteraceae bacterium]
MKFQKILFLSVFSIVSALSFAGFCAAENSSPPPPDHDELTEKIFNLLYQKKENTEQFKKVELKDLLKELANLEKNTTNEGDKNAIIFVRAESYYRLGKPKKAYVAFFRVKLRLNTKDHPLYPIVEKRLKKLARELKPMKKPKKDHAHIDLAILVSILFAIFGIILIVYDLKRSKRQRYDARILDKNSLISYEEMREQDGRCSKNAVSEYLNWRKELPDEQKSWDELSPAKREKLKYARLIIKGHDMIEKVNKKAPYPISFISKIPYLNTIPHYWQYIITGVVFVGLWKGVESVGFCTEKSFGEYALLATFVISCLSGIRIMAEKTINALDELVSMLEPDGAEKSIKKLSRWVENLFRSHRQYYFFVIVMITVVFSLYYKNDLILKNSIQLNLDIIFCIFLVWIASSLIWFLTGSLFLMHKLCNLKDLSMNPLSPSKTMGLEKMISVIGTYNIVCSMVSSFGCSIAVYQAVKEGQNPLQGSFWFFFITPMLIFYWIYPYIKIGNLVKAKKINRMNFVKTKISLLFNEWKTSEDNLQYINEEKIYHKKNHSTPTSDPKNEKKNIDDKLKGMEQYYKIGSSD